MTAAPGAALARAFARVAAVQPPQPTIIACAVSGGVVTGNPNQPYTVEETIRSAAEAAAAGASMIHLHARAAAGGISREEADYAAIADGIREAAGDVVINVTTDGQGLKEGTLPASLAARPDVATIVWGSTRFGPGDEVLGGSAAAVKRLADELRARGVLPEYECFDLGMVAAAGELARRAEGPVGMVHLIAGTLAGLPAEPAAVLLVPQLLPAGVPWLVSSVADHFRTMALSVALGGHVRTGLEDVVYAAPGEHAASNAELVARARGLSEAIGRPVATAQQTRAIIGLGGEATAADA